MTYKTPSIRLTLNKNLFNRLISVLDININNKKEDENLSKIAEKLKEKLLTYSVLRLDDNKEEFIDVRFYPNESSNMIYQLLTKCNDISIKEDYFIEIKNSKTKYIG